MNHELLSHSRTNPLKFYIFGHPVTMSPSPDIHNVGFAANGFPHKYERFDTEDPAEVIATIKTSGCVPPAASRGRGAGRQ